MKKKIRIGVIGCGNIGRGLVKAIENGVIGCDVGGVLDRTKERGKLFSKEFNIDVPVAKDIEDLIQKSDIVVEAASQEAVREYGERILESGRSIMIMSVGAFSDSRLFQSMVGLAEKNRVKIYIPSGGIVGLDGVGAAKIDGIESIRLETIKHPSRFGLDDKKRRVLYDGPAMEGVKKFPRNINVAAALGLAGIGLDKTELRIISDPNVRENIHRVWVKGRFGEFTAETRNAPSPDNPRTSYLAVLSAIAALGEIVSSIRIGT